MTEFWDLPHDKPGEWHAEVAAAGWQPIETAPTDEPILVWADKLHRGLPSAEVVVMYRYEDGCDFWTNGGANAGDDLYFESPPTHWMPLPDPPQDQTRKPRLVEKEA